MRYRLNPLHLNSRLRDLAPGVATPGGCRERMNTHCSFFIVLIMLMLLMLMLALLPLMPTLLSYALALMLPIHAMF